MNTHTVYTVQGQLEKMPAFLVKEMFQTINSRFPDVNLKRRLDERVKVSGKFGRAVTNTLNKNVACMQKIYQGNGKNSYGYFMRLDAYEFFVDFVCNFEEILADRERTELINVMAMNTVIAKTQSSTARL